jgi:hypothetical protein
MRIATMAGMAGVALLAGTAAAQEIAYDFDRTANFASIRTYTWVSGHSLQDDLNHKRIVAAIDAQLAAKGLTKVEPGANPDALVAYHVGFARDLQISGYGSTWGGPPRPADLGPGRAGHRRYARGRPEGREDEGGDLAQQRDP